MSFKKNMIAAAGMAVTGMMFALPASAVPVLCEYITKNHMSVDSQFVSACVDAGVGNIGNGGGNDDFLAVNSGYTKIGSSELEGGDIVQEVWYTQSGYSGTFSLLSSLWNTWDTISIGFKFGTGNKPDNWFVYNLNDGITSGNWTFIGEFARGKGLSHMTLYGSNGTKVPEPGTLALFGIALAGVGLVRRRKQQQSI